MSNLLNLSFLLSFNGVIDKLDAIGASVLEVVFSSHIRTRIVAETSKIGWQAC